MAENTPHTPDESVDPTETQPTRLQVFVNNHPRIAKVTAITGAVTSVAGAVVVAKTVQANRAHVEAAGEHAKEALNELSTAVSPDDTEA
jgi:hypothetical protein